MAVLLHNAEALMLTTTKSQRNEEAAVIVHAPNPDVHDVHIAQARCWCLPHRVETHGAFYSSFDQPFGPE